MILDTHVWIWFLTNHSSLSDAIKKQINDNPKKFYISAISIWEACLLAENGKLNFGRVEPATVLRELLKEVPIQVASLNSEIALFSRELKFNHNDPADRFIAATAHAYQLPLVTADKELKKLKWLKVIKA